MTNSFQLITSTANRLTRQLFSDFLSSWLVPIDYTRTREIPTLLDLSGLLQRTNEKLRVLDIGSPQILSLTLALTSENWQVTYINPYDPELEDLRKKAGVLGLRKLQILNADVTNRDSMKDLGTFDFVFSCSVFEHIHPESGGDTIAAANLSSLLNPDGLFVFSVPFYKNSFHEYRNESVYGVECRPCEKVFFQRFYDEQSLQAQIIEPTRLKRAGATYIGERYYYPKNIHKRMAFLVGYGKSSVIFGRFFKNISGLFMEESPDWSTLKKPYLAIISLVKDSRANS